LKIIHKRKANYAGYIVSYLQFVKLREGKHDDEMS